MEEHINCLQSSSFPSQVITVAFLSPKPKTLESSLTSLFSHPTSNPSASPTYKNLATHHHQPCEHAALSHSHLSAKYCRRLLTDLPVITLTLLLSPYTAARVSVAQNLPLTSHLTPIKSQGLHKHLQALTWSAANHTLTSPVHLPVHTSYCNWKWGLATLPSKANKEAKLVCFILDAGNCAEGGLLSKGRLPPTDNQWVRAFIGEGRGLHSETAQSALTVILKLVIRGLTSVILF